jgi:hypothetical protein
MKATYVIVAALLIASGYFSVVFVAQKSEEARIIGFRRNGLIRSGQVEPPPPNQSFLDLSVSYRGSSTRTSSRSRGGWMRLFSRTPSSGHRVGGRRPRTRGSEKEGI